MRRSVHSLAAATVIFLAIAACSAAPGTTSTPSPSASITPSPPAEAQSSTPPSEPPMPSAEPSESLGADSVPIPPDTYARVVTDGLRVRSKPGVSDDSKKLEPLLQQEELLVVLDGPVEASGYHWYQVQPVIPVDVGVESIPFGWVAAADKDGEPWIAPTAVNCPQQPNDAYGLTNLIDGVDMFYGVTCFGGRELTITARLAAPEIHCGAEPLWVVEPAWFQKCMSGDYFLAPLDITEALYFPAFAPGVDTSIAGEPDGEQSEWPVVEAVGMFDHPDAMTCRPDTYLDAPALPEPDPAQTILGCRNQFVVTAMRLNGR